MDEILCGETATILLSEKVARKVYLPRFQHLANDEIEALEKAAEIGLPVPSLLTVVYSEDSTVTEICTTRIVGKSLCELTLKNYNLAMEKVRRWVRIALRHGLVLDIQELTSVKGNIRVDHTGKVWFIDLN